MPPSASLTIRVGGREVSRAEFTEVAEAKFSHKDGKDGRHHTVVCPGCSKSGHMQKAGSAKLAGGRRSHAFLCTNCGQSSTVINGPGEAIQSGGSEDNNPAPKMQEAEVSADHPSNCKLPHAKMAKRGRRVCPSCKAGLKLEEGVYVEAKHRRDHGKFAEKPGGKFQAKGRGGKIASTISGVGVARVKGMDKLRLANMMEPAPEAATIHIGLSSHAKDRMMRTSQEFSAGKTTTLNGHTSGSRAEQVAKQFGGGHVLHLEVPKGHPIYEPAKHNNQFPAEREVVIPHGSKVQVTRSVLKDGKHHHYGKLVGRSLQEANAAAAGWEAGYELEEAACPSCGHTAAPKAGRCVGCGINYKSIIAKTNVLTENKEGTSQAKAATPEPFSKSKTSNWVARAGGLPPYIQHIAHDIAEKRGKTVSEAIGIAIGVVKNWAHGHGNVTADTKAAAAKALAQWSALKAKNAAKKVAGKLSEAEERDWTRLHALFESAEPVQLEEAEERELAEGLLEESRNAPGPKGHRKAPETPEGVESAGERVAHLQRRLSSIGHELKPDGHFGPVTAAAVKEFQAGAMLKEDGIVGPKTTEALKGAPHPDEMAAAEQEGEPGVPRPELTDAEMLSDPPNPSAGAPSSAGGQAGSGQDVLFKGIAVGEKSGHKGVRQLQSGMGGLGYSVMTDGVFGPETEKVVKRFQRKYGLKPDGIVGEKTNRVLKTVGDRAKKLSEAVEARKAATGGRDFSRALARERHLREQLEEGFNAAVLVADALRQNPDATAVIAALLGERGEATALLEANAGLEALIAKLVAKGIPEDQAAAVAAKAISQGKGGGVPKPGKRGKKAKVSAPKAPGVEMHRMPNGMFAPKGQGQVLKAGQAVSVPHATEKGAMVPGTVTDVQPVAGMKKPEPGTASVELHSGPDKGKPFQVAASHDPAWARSADGEDGPAGSNGYDDPADPEIDPSTGEAYDQAQQEKEGADNGPTVLNSQDIEPGEHFVYNGSHFVAAGRDEDGFLKAVPQDPEEGESGAAHLLGNVDVVGFGKGVEPSPGQVADAAELESSSGAPKKDVWGGPKIGSKIKDKAGNEGEIVAHHDHPSGDPEKKMFSVKHPGGTSKVGFGKLADTMAGKKEWGAGKKPKGGEKTEMGPATVHAPGGPLTKDGSWAVTDDDGNKVGHFGSKDEAHGAAQKLADSRKPKDETTDDHVGDTSPTGHDLAASPGRGPTGKLRNFKAMSPPKLKKTIADLEDFGGDPEALAAVKKVAQEKGVAWAAGKGAAKPKSKGTPIKTKYSPDLAGLKQEMADKASAQQAGGAKAQSGTVHKALKQVANGKTASMSSKRKQDLVSRGFAKWDGPGELSLTDKGNEMIGKSQGSKSGGGFTPEQMEKAGKAAKAAGAPKSKVAQAAAAADASSSADLTAQAAKMGKPGDIVEFPNGKQYKISSVSGGKTFAQPITDGKPEKQAESINVGDAKPVSSGAPLGQSATPSPQEEMGAAGEMGPNTGNLSLKDMPLGTTFQMNGGKEYVLHKPVNDPYMIAKPTDGGKAKPLHKMLAPPQVGPIAPGYEGAGGPGPTSAPAAAAPEDPDALFNKLSASVDVAKAAKASGASPAEVFKQPPAPDKGKQMADMANATVNAGAAPVADASTDPAAAAAVAAYKAAGGNDPAVIKALGG